MVNYNSLLLILVSQSLSLYITEMNDDEQIFTTIVRMDLNHFNNLNSCLTQGIWTRYNPLSQIPQIGDIGIFESDCYNIHNVIQEQTGLTNFLYFDCIDNQSQTIKKIIQFVDDEEVQHNFQIDLDPLKYENTWFYFGISIFPLRNKVQLIFLQNLDQIFFQDLDIIFPFYDKNIKITFGGSLTLIEQKRIQTYKQIQIFSYFPGKMYLNHPLISDIYYQSQTTHEDIDYYLSDIKQFECSDSMLEMFTHDEIKFVSIKTTLTENNFLYSYQFSGWIKVTEIHQTDEKFLYKLIKIQSNSENNLLTNDNLSPFQLLYRFEGNKQYLQILTYSYTFPSVTLDFSQNQFLIKKEVLLIKQIEQWHYLYVKFIENELKVDIIYYDKVDQFNLNFAINVNHFHYMKLKIQFGNLFQNSQNYINFRILSFIFAPCLIQISIEGCHQSCQSCDGPTQNDCLSCYLNQKRIYQPELKNCVCPENMVDQNNNCITLEKLIQPFSKTFDSGLKCQFGYFLFDENTCLKWQKSIYFSPSNPNLNTFSCFECIQNPYTWKSQATCKKSLFYNKSDSQIFSVFEEQFEITTFTSDSTDLQLCINCQIQSLSNEEDIYENFLLIKNISDDILRYNIQNEMQYCSLQFCFRCFQKNDELQCLECDDGYSLQNNLCQRTINNLYCVPPFYKNSRKQCQLCEIEYCSYCFEFLKNDLSKSTLYKDFEIFEIDEFHTIGCALCKEGFQYNFMLSKCIFQQPNVQNCIRSFIKFDGQEVCTLSNLQTFDLSPEINNCQNKILQCQQCIKTPSQIIKCIVCNDGYSANIITGKCLICPIQNSKICIQGESLERNGWIQLVQSFIIQFLNKKYFHPNGIKIYIYDQVISCLEGYRPTQQNKCLPYCNSECLKCVEIDKVGFQCLECPLNNRNLIQRSSNKTVCLKCPKLCSFCQIRAVEEIKLINPYFIITDENIQFTYKCFQTAFKENTIIDSKLQIAKQIFENEEYILNFNFEVECDYISDYKFYRDFYDDQNVEYVDDYQSQININYCNEQGIENLQITIQYKLNINQYCFQYFVPQIFDNTLKQEIFSLNFISFILTGISFNNLEVNIFRNPVEIRNYDQVNLEFMNFFLAEDLYFSFSNQNLMSIHFYNVIFSSDLKPINFRIENTDINQIDLDNIIFQQVNFTNTIVFNIIGEYIENKTYLNNLKISNCSFSNSIFIKFFSSTFEIIIQNLTIENSIFQNSTLIFLDGNRSSNQNNYGQFHSVKLRNNQFYNSECFKIQEFHRFRIINIRISECYFNKSNLYSIMTLNLDIIQANILNNIFLTSSLFISINEQKEIETNFEISNLSLNTNQFYDSYSFQITPKFNQRYQNIQIYLNNLLIEKNSASDNLIQSFIFYIHSNAIFVQNVKIIEQLNISFLYIYETKSIKIQQLELENSIQNKKIPLGSHCQSSLNSLQVLKIYGFIDITLENIKINRQNTQDLPFIELVSNIFWNAEQIEKVSIQNINFTENILLKQTLGKRLSQILIFSENRQNIFFKAIYFQNNLLHQTVDDSSNTVAGLIFIKSVQSTTEIFDFVSTNNWITNSSSSFLYAEVDFLSINNYKCRNLNNFNQYFISNYLSIQKNFKQNSQNSQEEIQLIIQKILSIKTKGCACYVTARQLQIKNGQFKQIFSKTSPLFEIYTQSLGLIILQNLQISQIEVIQESYTDLQGSIHIFSSSSNLDLQLSNIEFVEVFNKFSPSIISITPSQSKNLINFQNITIKNSISLKNQVIKIEFSQENKEQNKIQFFNITITQTEQTWIRYFERIGQINFDDLEKIKNDNALIHFANCELTLQSIISQGVFIAPIIKIVNSVKLKISNCQFNQIQIFYFFNLIQIEQNKQHFIIVQLFNNEFRKVSLFSSQLNKIIEKLQIDNQNISFECLLNFETIFFSKINFAFNSIINLFQSEQNQSQGSLLEILSYSNQAQIYFSQMNLIENNCNFCLQGLVYFNIVQIKKLKLTQFYCIKNQILAYGCLNVKSNKMYQNQFQISNSIFGQNQGQSGLGIYFSGLKGIIKNNLIFNNTAFQLSGGIIIVNDDNDFLLNNTLIFQNNGYKCGGLLLQSTSNLNSTNFIQSYLQFNEASFLANNLFEAPTQLQLQINGQILRSHKKIYENTTENTLWLENYKLQQHDGHIETKYLLIPSNQKLAEYKIFDLKSQVFKQYIYDISLQFLNSYQEKLGDFDSQSCSIFQNILHQNGSLKHQYEKFILYFNTETNKIDLGDLYFTFDPYEQNNSIQQIEIFCKIDNNRALSYKFNTKSFFCQLGEFYSQGGCQICEANYGFYSVTYNATKCSIFDKTKFQAITQNTISLLPGFWRPNYHSDFPEQCFKNIKFCLGEWFVGDQSCLYGHLGGLCEECDYYNVRGDGFFFQNPDNTGCLLCDESKSYVIIFIFASCLAIFSILITLNSIATTNKLFASLKTLEKFGKIIFKLNQDYSSFLLKMFFNYLWIFSIIFTYNITFSINLAAIDIACNTSYFMANNLDCFLSSIQDVNLIYIRIIGTIVFIFIQIILICLFFFVFSNFRKSQFDKSIISNICLYLYISNHASLIKQFCSLIAKRVISNITYVQGNVSLQFYSENHQNWFYYFVIPGLSINGCVIPFLLIVLLYTKRNQLDQIRVRKHICYLFNEYNEKSYYWEQIKIWQKTLIILIITYFEDDILLKTTLLGLSLMLYQFLAFIQKPYIISNLNKLDIETGQICSIAIFLAAVRSGSTSSKQASTVIQIIIILLCLQLIYLYFSVILKVYLQKHKIRILQYLWILFKSMLPNSNISKYFDNLHFQEKSKKAQVQKNYEKLKQNFNGIIKTFRLKEMHRIQRQEREKKFGSVDFDTVNQITLKQLLSNR